MALDHIVLITLGAFAGGFVSGLAGFGTGMVALGIWLHVLLPAPAAALAAICSVVSQVQTAPTIWRSIQPGRVLPFIVPGLIGVPIGTRLLTLIDPNAFRFGIGVLLLVYSTFLLIRGTGMKWDGGGRIADGFVGFAGGILGGLAGLSGPLPTMWASFRGWGKDERRGLFQTFNLTILAAAVLSLAVSGRLTAEVGWATLAALPGTLAGSWLGSRAYLRLSDLHFHKVILVLLAFSGLTLVWAGW